MLPRSRDFKEGVFKVGDGNGCSVRKGEVLGPPMSKNAVLPLPEYLAWQSVQYFGSAVIEPTGLCSENFCRHIQNKMALPNKQQA